MRPRISRLFFALFLVALFSLCLLFLAMNRWKLQTQSTQCAAHITTLSAAARKWAVEHQDEFPRDWRFLERLTTPQILVCPADKSNPLLLSTNWLSPTLAEMASYELLAPGLTNSRARPEVVLLRCKLHHWQAFADGSVSMPPPKPKS